MRGVGAFGGLVGYGLAAACGDASAFPCSSDAQCGIGGRCDEPGFCSFDDDTCDSGRRFGDHAGDGLAKQCVPVVAGATSSTGAAPQTGTAADTTSSGLDSATTNPLDGSGTSSSSTGTTALVGTTSTGLEGASTDSTGTTSGSLVPEGLIAWYRFEVEQDGGGVVDSSGNGHHGGCTDCPTLGPGVIQQGGVFAGTEDVVVPSSPDLEPDTLTLAAWVDVNLNIVQTQHIVGKTVGMASRNSWELFMITATSGDREVRMVVGSPEGVVFANAELTEGGWHHLAGTFDGVNARVYVDGEFIDASAVATLGYDGSPARIAHDRDSGVNVNELIGSLDDLRIYDFALSEGEIFELTVLP